MALSIHASAISTYGSSVTARQSVVPSNGRHYLAQGGTHWTRANWGELKERFREFKRCNKDILFVWRFPLDYDLVGLVVHLRYHVRSRRSFCKRDTPSRFYGLLLTRMYELNSRLQHRSLFAEREVAVHQTHNSSRLKRPSNAPT